MAQYAPLQRQPVLVVEDLPTRYHDTYNRFCGTKLQFHRQPDG